MLYAWVVPLAVLVAAYGIPVALGEPWAAIPLVVILGAGAFSLLARGPVAATEPGHDLSPDEEPRLWALVERGAEAAGTAACDRLRVTSSPSVTADRRHRTMTVTIGLPWLAESEDALEAAVVHALAGDRAGAPSRLRQHVVGALELAPERIDGLGLLGLPWVPYARGATRTRAAIARRQAAVADRETARALGAAALAASRQAAERTSIFPQWWARAVAPCLTDGFAPPIVTRWADFWEGDRAAPADAGRPDAVGAGLGLERRVLSAVLPDAARDLVDLPSEEIARAVILPRARAALGRTATEMPLPELVLADLPAVVAAPPDDVPAEQWADMLVAAATIALVDDEGWDAEATADGSLLLHRDDEGLAPYALIDALAEGRLDADEWRRFVDDAGIADVVVSPPPAPAEPAGDVLTTVPPTPPRVLHLAPPPRRLLSFAAIALLAALAAPVGGLALVGGLLAPPDGLTAGGRVVIVAIGLFMLGALVVVGRARLRVLVQRGTLTVGADEVRIDHPAVLRAPLVIPRTSVRSVHVDDGDWSPWCRFPFGDVENAVAVGLERSPEISWLWRAGSGCALPLIGAGSELPNVALLLDDPSLAPRVRRRTATGPLRGEALAGLVFAVEDAGAARVAFSPWGLTRLGRPSDAVRVAEVLHGPRDAPTADPRPTS